MYFDLPEETRDLQDMVCEFGAKKIAPNAAEWSGAETQKQRWPAPLARGEAFGAFGPTEPGAGSDAAGISTTARRADGGWLINGTKMFITRAGTGISQGVTLLTDRHERGRAETVRHLLRPDRDRGHSCGSWRSARA
ncbi:acyl-CoA dehydrogenase family protein [Streptomyces sp. ADMS]|uniref:acyl-CoA dehydrogenase family protein n=1 Tax=Streptomyces sp. ADMS TaxID=3071415 RepID=UPI00296F0E04|nr:acyl-CoA dehydrogenase family protein [Streptomyces sp. ADMS]MDW4906626.1 acyl-CoA dehydrogenase family protein [Streptomyces sp. ADMS]